MAWLALEYLTDIGNRAAIILLHVENRGTPVPAFDVVRFNLDDPVEQPDGKVEILCLDRGLHAHHQKICGVAARGCPDGPDALFNRLRRGVVGRELERAEQEIETAGAIDARHLRLGRLFAALTGLCDGRPGRGHARGQGRGEECYKESRARKHGRSVVPPSAMANQYARWNR